MEDLINSSYVFLPFTFRDTADYKAAISILEEGRLWRPYPDRLKYMLRYITDKLTRTGDSCQCYHYVLKETAREAFGLGRAEDMFTSTGRVTEKTETFRFQIPEIHLYCFSTTVGILAFRLSFEESDPMTISDAQWYLKKVSRQKISLDPARPTTMLDIAKSLTGELGGNREIGYFFYANDTSERANMLTYLEVPPQEDYRKELYYLRRCYGRGYQHTETEEQYKKETLSLQRDIIWGISPEAAVCLACPGPGREGFIRNEFYPNFNREYLFMYVLLLHQKYVLYMFLTKLGVASRKTLPELEDYRQQLYEFETNFVFSCVTEVPQYQTLYEKMTEAFALKQMYEDVHEPLLALSEERRISKERERAARDNKVSKALLLLSVLTVFSALVDSFDFLQGISQSILPMSEAVVKHVQFGAIALILGVLAYVIHTVNATGDRKPKKQCARRKKDKGRQ